MTSPVPSPSDLASLFDLTGTIGAAFIGMVASAIMFGVSNLQLYIYYQQFPNDWMVYRVSVGLLWFIDALNLACCIHAVYHYCVASFGVWEALLPIVWSFKLQVATNVVVIVLVQCLYCLRLWKLNARKTVLPRLVPLAVAGGAGIGVALVIETYKMKTFIDISKMAWATYASFGIVAFIDFVIAGTMCFYLRGSRSDFQSTNSRISALILWTLSTGLATSVCSLVALVAFIVMPHNLVFLAIEFLLTKLYYNSFLAMLNARIVIKAQGISSDHYSLNLSGISHLPPTPRSPGFLMSDKFTPVPPPASRRESRNSAWQPQTTFALPIVHKGGPPESDAASADSWSQISELPRGPRAV